MRFGDTPRAEVRRELLAEIEAELTRRQMEATTPEVVLPEVVSPDMPEAVVLDGEG